MYGCFPFRSHRRQAPHHGGGVSVTVVSCGEGSVDGAARVKIVVSRGELERIAAGVTRRQLGAAARRRHVTAPAESPEEQQLTRACDPLRRRQAESEGGAAARRGESQPALGGIPEEV